MHDPKANGGEFDDLQTTSKSNSSEFAAGFASFFKDIDRVSEHFKALSGELGESAQKKALAAELTLNIASAAFYFDATIEVKGKTISIRNAAQKALTKSFNNHTAFFAGRATAQSSVVMFATTIGKKALGLKSLSKTIGRSLSFSLWLGSAGSLLTISSYGRGLTLFDQGVRDPVKLLSGSFIGRN